jgi:hypothetical protein
VRRERELEWAICVYLVLVASLAYVAFRDWAYDDPFITFRYADNLRSGLGFVYNANERVLSTTAPLYALLLAGLGLVWQDLPSRSNLISALSLALGGFFLYIIGRRWQEPLAGLVATVLYPVFPLMVNTFGAETCFYAMLILGAFALHAGEQHYGAMALLALATLTRSDGLVAGLVLGADLLITQRRVPWGPALLFAALIAPWYLFAWTYFGSPLPATLAAKQQQAQMAISQGFAPGFLSLISGYAEEPFYWLHGALAVAGIFFSALRNRRWLPFLCWGVVYFVSYTLLRVSRYFWYYAPLIPVILSAVGLGLAAVKHWLPPEVIQGWRRWAVLPVVLPVMLLLLLYPQAEGLRHSYHHPDQRAAIYEAVGTWLAENAPPDATIATLEVGIIGYYAERRMVGFAGLIQPEIAQRLSRETMYREAAAWAIETYRPDYLVLDPRWFPGLIGDEIGQTGEPVKSFDGARYGYDGDIVVYDSSEARAR